MIKAKQVFFWTSNLKGHGCHGNKATILYLTSEYYSLSVLSAKLYFLEIGPVHQNLWSFKCMILKTLNSNFLHWEDTLITRGLILSIVTRKERSVVGRLYEFPCLFFFTKRIRERNSRLENIVLISAFYHRKTYVCKGRGPVWVLATRIDGDLPTKVWYSYPIWEKIFKDLYLVWSINQCYCSRTMELLLFYRLL